MRRLHLVHRLSVMDSPERLMMMLGSRGALPGVSRKPLAKIGPRCCDVEVRIRATPLLRLVSQNNAPSREGPVPGQVLSQNATRPSDRDQASLSSCLLTQPVPWFILCLFLETGWVLTLPPYHPTSVRQDSYLLLFLFQLPRYWGVIQHVIPVMFRNLSSSCYAASRSELSIARHGHPS